MPKKRYLNLLIFIICLAIGTYVFAKEKLEGYEFLWIIPIAFGISNLLFDFLDKKYFNGIGTYTLFGMMFLKYVLTPFTIVLTNSYYGTGIGYGIQPQSENVEFSIWLTLYECITIFIVTKIYKMHLYKKQIEKRESKEESEKVKKNTYKVLIVLGIMCLIIISKYLPKLISNNFLIISSEVSQNNIDGEHSGIYSVLYSFAKIFLFIGIVEFIVTRYKDNSKIVAIIYIIISILYLGLNTGISRWAMLIPILQMVYIAIKIFPKNKKIIITTLSILAIVSITSITIYKFNIEIQDNESKLVKSTTELAKSMQSYLSGPRNIALAVEMKEVYYENISFSTIINSTFSSVPYISNFINTNDRFAKYYNDYIFGNDKWEDQIIPSIGEGYALFGIIGCNIFTIIYVFLVIYFDKKLENERDIKYIFVYSYICIRFANSLGLNLAILMSSFLGKMVPLIILFKCIDKLNIKNRISEESVR